MLLLSESIAIYFPILIQEVVRMEQPDGFVEVTFDDLEVRAYEAQGKVQFTAKAADIHAV